LRFIIGNPINHLFESFCSSVGKHRRGRSHRPGLSEGESRARCACSPGAKGCKETEGRPVWSGNSWHNSDGGFRCSLQETAKEALLAMHSSPWADTNRGINLPLWSHGTPFGRRSNTRSTVSYKEDCRAAAERFHLGWNPEPWDKRSPRGGRSDYCVTRELQPDVEVDWSLESSLDGSDNQLSRAVEVAKGM
jgi:hypothetical protein